jgi:hypothetical protein
MKIIDPWFKCTIIHFKNYVCTQYMYVCNIYYQKPKRIDTSTLKRNNS